MTPRPTFLAPKLSSFTFRLYFLRPRLLFDDRRGTLPPLRRVSSSAMAIACLRLLTRLPERPLLRVPRLRRRIADSTFFCAALPYFAIVTSAADGCKERAHV